MAKFRIRLKLQGLEVEIDGEREDIPAITTAVKQQLTGLVIPAEFVADDTKQLSDGGGGSSSSSEEDKKKPRSKRNSASRGGGEPAAQAIEFRHEPEKYGNPTQDWSLTEKCIWLLYVIKGIKDIKEVSGPQLAATFNLYFKPSGKLHPPHVTMYLTKAKVLNPAPVGEDKGNYYLTDAGEKQAEQLIQAVLNSSK